MRTDSCLFSLNPDQHHIISCPCFYFAQCTSRWLYCALCWMTLPIPICICSLCLDQVGPIRVEWWDICALYIDRLLLEWLKEKWDTLFNDVLHVMSLLTILESLSTASLGSITWKGKQGSNSSSNGRLNLSKKAFYASACTHDYGKWNFLHRIVFMRLPVLTFWIQGMSSFPPNTAELAIVKALCIFDHSIRFILPHTPK